MKKPLYLIKEMYKKNTCGFNSYLFSPKIKYI